MEVTAYEKNIKRYTAILLVVAMVFPSSPVYGNMEDEYELLLESKDSKEYQKATDSNAQKNDEDEDIHEDEELIDDIQKASPSDAEEEDKDEVELEQNLAVGKKIVSWKWNDKQEALIDGELQLAVTEVDQISFDDVVSMLPESITAEVLEDGKAAETEISVSGWNCDLYKIDEEGKWPTEGEYLFEAEMPDEYELDAGTDELSVKVTLEDPGVMLLEDMTSLTITDKNGQTQTKFSISGNTYTGNGYTIIKETQENQYKLVLDGIDAQSIELKEGIWTVELKNSNKLSGGSTGFSVESFVGSVTFTGDGKLDITATNNGFIQFSKVTIALQESGKITSYSPRSKEREGGFCIYRGSTLNIENGTLEAKGGKYGLVIAQNDGKIYMSGGNVIATGDVCAFEQSGLNTLFQQTGGVITCNGMIRLVNPDSKIIINGGKMIADGNLMIQNGGSFNLQSGEFVLNGNCMDDGAGTFVKTGGTLSGTGNLGSKKLVLTIGEKNISNALSVGSSVTPDSFFDIPSECGILTYSVTNETGSAHIDNGKLIADSVGTVKLKVTSADTNFYKSAEKEIELSVEKGTLQNVVVTPYSGTYDGVEHDAVTVTVGGKAPAADMKIRYAKVTDTGIENFTDEMPKVKNCSDSGIQYKVEISGDNYMTQVFTSTGINISKYNLAYTSLALSNSTFTYNGQEQIPNITAAIMKNGNKLEVIPDSSYSISYKKGSDYCENPTDVGTYAIILTAKDTAENYTGTYSHYGTDGLFEIIPKTLTLAITGTLTKTYDGTQDVNVDVKIVLQDGSDIVEGISAEADSISYNDPNAGDHKAITATGIHITSGNEKGNYTLSTDTATAVRVIEKAELQNVHVEQNGELFYNGKEQSATTKKHADVTFGSSEQVQFTYGLSEDGTFTDSVPAFKNRGSYFVYYKASYPNYNDYIGLLEVIIQPGNLAGATVTISPETSVYTGQEQTPSSVKVVLGDVTLPKSDYEILYRREGQENGFVTPKDAGTYQVIISGTDNLFGSWKCETFTITKSSPIIQVKSTYTKEFVYTGKEIMQPAASDLEITEAYDGDVQYTWRDLTSQAISSEVPVAVGRYELIATIPESNNNNSASCTWPFDIVEKSIEGEDITISLSETDFPYDENVNQPKITVMDLSRNQELVENTDYTLSMPGSVNAGENYEIVVTGRGNYKGTRKAYYNITKQDLKDAEVTISGTYVYHGSPVEPEPSQIRVVLNGLLVNASEYEVEYANNDAIGAATVLIKAKDTGNYVGNAHGTFEILDPKTNQVAVSSQVTVAKNSDAKTFTATIQAIDGAEYSFDGVTWSDNNQKTDCQPSTAYSAFIRMKETDTAHVSPATELKFTTPEIKQRSDSSSGGGSSSSSDSDSSSSSSGTAKDPVRGNVTSDKGIITGANNSMANDGYSHWMQDEHGWWLRFANNSYPKGAKSGEAGATYAWELINGNWWAFDENGYAKTGWLRDDTYNGWFYADPDTGMKIGWVLINGKWYYFHPTSDGKRGIMYAGQNTPDGYYVDETGAWDGKER